MRKQTLPDLFKLVYDRDRVILIAYYVMGWSHAEIARELRITRQRVHEIRMRAIKRLGIAWEVLEAEESMHLFRFRYHRRHPRNGGERR